MIHPATILELPPQYGTGDMGDVTDVNSVARFGMRDAETGFSLAFLVAKAISGTGGEGRLSLLVDHPSGPNFDWEPWFKESFGRASDASAEEFFTVPDEQLRNYAIRRDKVSGEIGEFCFKWSNISPTPWILIVGLIDHALIPNFP